MAGSRILIVEDEPLLAKELSAQLATMEHQVVGHAESGEEALAIAAETRPDLVLMDVSLQGNMDGIETVSALRTILDVPVVYLTAATSRVLFERAKITEPHAYLTKPVSTQELARTIDMALYQHEMQRKIRESEQRLRVIVDSMDDFMFMLDTQGRFVGFHVSPRSAALLHAEPEQCVGKRYDEVLPEDVAASLREAIAVLQSTGETQEFDYHFLGHGTNAWFTTRVSMITDHLGNPDSYVVVARDITARKSMESELSERISALQIAHERSEALLACVKAILEHREFEVCARRIFDAAKKITKATAGYVALMSPNRNENLVLFLDSGGRTCEVNPNLPMPIRGLRSEAYTSKTAVFDNQFRTGQWVKYLPQGHMTLDSVMFAPMIIDDEPVGVIGLANKEGGFAQEDLEIMGAFAEFAAVALRNSRTQEALVQSEERFRLLAENIEEAFWLTKPGKPRRIDYLSPGHEGLWGASAEHFYRNPQAWANSIHELDRERVIHTYELFLEGEGPFDLEYRIVQPDGSIRWVQDQAFPIHDEHGRLDRVAGVARDVTGQKAYEDRQKRLMEEIRHFAYIVSHDLRAPLINIKGFCRELESVVETIGPPVHRALAELSAEEASLVKAAFEDDIAESLHFIDSATTRMNGLIEAILKLSRLERTELVFEPLGMNHLVRSVLESLSHSISEKHAQVTVGPLPETHADRVAMEQIISNLLDNAIKYLDPHRRGVITISGWSLSDEHVFQVRDNGMGIDQLDREKVFEIFQRSRNANAPGEGMGLAYVRTLVRRHGGRIWCESAPGEGSVFTFTISAGMCDRVPPDVNAICSPGNDA